MLVYKILLHCTNRISNNFYNISYCVPVPKKKTMGFINKIFLMKESFPQKFLKKECYNFHYYYIMELKKFVFIR